MNYSLELFQNELDVVPPYFLQLAEVPPFESLSTTHDTHDLGVFGQWPRRRSMITAQGWPTIMVGCKP